MDGSFRSCHHEGPDLGGTHLTEHFGDAPQRATSFPQVVDEHNPSPLDSIGPCLNGRRQQRGAFMQRYVLHLRCRGGLDRCGGSRRDPERRRYSCSDQQAPKFERKLGVSCLVDLEGFEPSTSSMPWKRAPNCATGPQARQVLV